MRIVVIPGVLLLAVGGWLYSAFHTNKQALEATDERPRVAFASALDLAGSMKAGAERYRKQLGVWPATLGDVGLDEKWMEAHRGVEDVSYGANGSVHVHLAAAIDGPATWLMWTPHEHGERMIWGCVSDNPKIGTTIEGCVAVDAATLAQSEHADPGEPGPIDVPGLDERCLALGKVGYAAAQARDAGEAIDHFLRQPIVAWVDDDRRKRELEEAARWVYGGPVRAPSATQRQVLDAYRCSAS